MNKENKILSDLNRPQKILALVMGAIIALVVMVLLLKDAQDMLNLL